MNFLETDKLIILSYPGGAGGKFVSNCLALSASVFPMVPNLKMQSVFVHKVIDRISADLQPHGTVDEVAGILRELNAEAGKDESGRLAIQIENWPHFLLRFFRRFTDVEMRLDWMRGSLSKSKDEFSSEWLNLEFSAVETYGTHYSYPEFRDPVFLSSSYFQELLESSLYHFNVIHRGDKFLTFKRYIYPNCRQIRFHNTLKWIDYCLSLGKGLGEDLDVDTPETVLVPGGIDFDVESFFSASAFLQEVEKLYRHFDLPDFNPDAVSVFHRDYMAVHGITL